MRIRIPAHFQILPICHRHPLPPAPSSSCATRSKTTPALHKRSPMSGVLDPGPANYSREDGWKTAGIGLPHAEDAHIRYTEAGSYASRTTGTQHNPRKADRERVDGARQLRTATEVAQRASRACATAPAFPEGLSSPTPQNSLSEREILSPAVTTTCGKPKAARWPAGRRNQCPGRSSAGDGGGKHESGNRPRCCGTASLRTRDFGAAAACLVVPADHWPVAPAVYPRHAGGALAAIGVVHHSISGRGPVLVGRAYGVEPLAVRHTSPG